MNNFKATVDLFIRSLDHARVHLHSASDAIIINYAPSNVHVAAVYSTASHIAPVDHVCIAWTRVWVCSCAGSVFGSWDDRRIGGSCTVATVHMLAEVFILRKSSPTFLTCKGLFAPVRAHVPGQ
jgi:hypothetical protein